MTRRTAGLFLAALLGVLVVVGIVMVELGSAALAAYGVVVAAGLVLMARQARRLRPAQDTTDGRTCACCTTTVFDPITVVDRIQDEAVG